MTAVAADVALRQLTSTVGLSQLLGDDHLAEFKEWQRENREARAPDAIAWLVDQGWVTRWQGQQLLAGNHSFFLRHYKLVNRLGGGGMGTVFQAIDDRSGRLVAVKVLRKSAVQRPNTLERFRREIAALGKLRHPNIVAAYEAGQLNGYHYLVMEYIEGRDLGYWINKLKRLPIDLACEIARQAALGLDHAHRLGFIHRDIKPSNLIAVRKSDGVIDVRILDFGLARNFDGASEEARVTKAGQIVGTVDYLAPEQAQGSKDVDGRADVYSLGVTLFEMIAGQPPFTGESMMARLIARVMHPAPLLSEFLPDAPPALVEAIEKALAMRADDRFATAGELAEALAGIEVQAKKSLSMATTVEMPAAPVEGVVETMVRTPEPAAPIGDEFQKALSDKAQSTGDSQQFTLPSWLKRRRLWVGAAAAVMLLGLVAVMLIRSS
jgi:serine/threonine protein kinase